MRILRTNLKKKPATLNTTGLQIETGWVSSGEAARGQIIVTRRLRNGRVARITIELAQPHVTETGARQAAEQYANEIRAHPEQFSRLFD